MTLWASITLRNLSFGGPGSGCHGPNCGKPKGTVVLKDSLRLPRGKMPQIPKEHYQHYFAWLKQHGVQVSYSVAHPASLKPIQKTVNRFIAKPWNGPMKPIITSGDNYILDGHHRWYGALQTGQTVPIVKVSLPMRDLLDLTHQYEHVEYHNPIRVKEEAVA